MESLEVFEDSPEIDQTSDIENWQMESGDVDMKVNMSKNLVSGKAPKLETQSWVKQQMLPFDRGTLALLELDELASLDSKFAEARWSTWGNSPSFRPRSYCV